MNKKAAADPVITLEKDDFLDINACGGWILYAEGDSSFNRHYVDLYRKACRRRGMFIRLGIYHPHAVKGNGFGEIWNFSGGEKPQYVVNRTRDYRLAEYLESMKVPVFNNSCVTRLGNDKSEAYRYMQQCKIPVMPTLYNMEEPPQWYPAVAKSCDGHGGTEVFLIRSKEEWKTWQEKRTHNKRYLMQQAASDLGKDVRVYVVGNKITAAVMRTSETDFRSNYCLGGRIRLYQLSGLERESVQRAIKGLSIGMAGIDFIFHEGEMVFNEIEDMAGARGLYSLTDYDIVDDYIRYIQEELHHAASIRR